MIFLLYCSIGQQLLLSGCYLRGMATDDKQAPAAFFFATDCTDEHGCINAKNL